MQRQGSGHAVMPSAGRGSLHSRAGSEAKQTRSVQTQHPSESHCTSSRASGSCPLPRVFHQRTRSSDWILAVLPRGKAEAETGPPGGSDLPRSEAELPEESCPGHELHVQSASSPPLCSKPHAAGTSLLPGGAGPYCPPFPSQPERHGNHQASPKPLICKLQNARWVFVTAKRVLTLKKSAGAQTSRGLGLAERALRDEVLQIATRVTSTKRSPPSAPRPCC